MAEDLARYPIVLAEDASSGLADLLHQYLEQSVAASPRKLARARRLRGEVVFQAAEDLEVRVRVAFRGDSIELRDAPPGPARASVRADFLSLAHLASGQANPLVLVARGRVRLVCPIGRLPFLLGVLGFLRLERQGAAPDWRWAAALVVLGAVAALGWWMLARW